MVVLFAYTKSCGACKEAREQLALLALDAARQRAGVRCCAHNCRNAFDGAFHDAMTWLARNPFHSDLFEGVAVTLAVI